MELIVNEKRENPLLDRVEIKFEIKHPKSATPKREDARNLIAAYLNVEKDRVIIAKMHTSFGLNKTVGYAKIYNNLESAKKIEPKHILKRHGLIGGEDNGKA